MTATKFSGKDLRGLKESDIDDLLSKLSAEELEELHMELVDPDDPHIPPSDRCRYRTDKESSGPFDREKLIEYLEKKAAQETDWQDAKPYVKETRGKVWKPKESEKVTVSRDEDEVAIETEWDDALENATEEELVDLAAILGFHGMLNQNQYHHAFVSGKQAKDLPGGLQAVTKCEPCKPFEMEQPNSTNIGECMKDLKNNSSSLKELNLNNIKDISDGTLQDLFQALKTNTHLEKLHMANTGLTDKNGKLLKDALESNKSLTFLNLESNFLSGTIIIELVRAINKNQTVVDFKVANQRPQVLGVKCEMEIADLLKSNDKILRLGIFLEVPQARNTISKILQRNNDALRKERLDKK